MHYKVVAYTISHTLQLVIGHMSYKSASAVIDTGMVDWAGDREAFHRLDVDSYVGYRIMYYLHR